MPARKLTLITLVGAAALAGAQPAAPPSAMPACASPEQTAAVSEFYGKMKAMLPLLATRTLKMPEAVIVSALKSDQALGVDGKNFSAVWDSARTWGDVVFFVSKGGNQFEINGSLPEGVQSTSSNTSISAPRRPASPATCGPTTSFRSTRSRSSRARRNSAA